MSEPRSFATATSRQLAWVLKLTRPFFHWHLASFACLTSAGLLSLLTPLVMRWLIDQVLPHRDVRLLLAAVGLIFFSYQGRAVLAGFGSYLSLSAAEQAGLRLRIALLRHFDTLSAEYYDNTPVGSILYSFKEPIEQICYFGSDLLPAILRLTLTMLFTLGAMAVLNPLLTLAILPLIPGFLLSRHYFRKRLAVSAETAQQNQAASNVFLQEHLSSVTSIQLLGQQGRQERQAFRLWGRATRSRQLVSQTAVWFTVSTSSAVVLAMCAVIGYGGRALLMGAMSLGSLVAFFTFVTQLFDPLSGAAEFYAKAQKTLINVRLIQMVFALYPSVPYPVEPTFLQPTHSSEIELTGVEFGYRRQKNVRVNHLRILAGEELVIFGDNGAGKSTLLKLIARMYDADSGSIRIGGADIRSIHLSDLRRFVAYLPRDPVLFGGSLATNLRFVRQSAAERDLHEVIECTGLGSCVLGLPNGIHQRIGPDCRQLSGGERQRLAIARALLQRPRIVMLDEATSCLDEFSEVLVLRNLRRYLPQATLIVVSHRPSTATACSRILVMESGCIVQDLSRAAFPSEPQFQLRCDRNK
jgi:ABC-type bacteriocin/lantibiotic exporter with double-glycine peptidase domain